MEDKLLVRNNYRLAGCRGCNKTIFVNKGIILESPFYWREGSKFVLCNDCAKDLLNELSEKLLGEHDENNI